jgi:hypothetical protein
MRKLLSITIVFVLLLMAFKCEDQKATQMKEAKIVFSGMLAADGCGWLLEVNGEEYSPINLEKSFEEDGLKVYVELTYLETGFQCGMNPNFKIPQVKIRSIKHFTD